MMYLLIFGAMMLLDYCYGEYTKAAADRRPLPAALWAMALFVIGCFVTSNWLSDPLLVAPAALGAFAGTYFSVRFGK